MSDGGTGDGVTYWATINIKGDLKKDQLRAVVAELRRVLGKKVTVDGQVNDNDGSPINGLIKQAARLANTTEPSVSVVMKVPPRDQ